VWIDATLDRLGECRANLGRIQLRIRNTLEILRDDVVLGDGLREELGRYLRNYTSLVLARPFTGHGRRRSDALKPLGREPLAHAADQQGHVRALPSAIGVQLVENQEPQALTVADHLLIDVVLPRHEQFEHHEVGEQDVGRVVGDLAPNIGFVLAGVPSEGHRPFARDVADELLELLQLAVRQGIHGVDDDGAGPRLAALRLLPQNGIHDGNEEAQGLARPRARGHHVALLIGGQSNGFLLMLVEHEGYATRLVGTCRGPEDLRAGRVEH